MSEKSYLEQQINSLEEEKIKVAYSMIKFGGDFVKSLGHALLHADFTNTYKIKNTFEQYWNIYLELSIKQEKNNEHNNDI